MGVADEEVELRRLRLSGIEGLRAVAAIAVLTYHVVLFSPAVGAPTLQLPLHGARVLANMRLGLTLFFVLSGFLLYRPFVAAAIAMRPLPSIRNYFRSRALRIVPAYWVILVATALILQSAVTSPTRNLAAGELTAPHTLVLDFLLVQNYDPATIFTGIGPAWSLGVEVVFYLLLPALAAGVLLLTRRTGRNVVVCALLPAALLLVIGVVTHVALAHGLTDRMPRWEAVVRNSFPAQADYFAFGMAAAVIHVLVTRRRLSIGRRVRVVAASTAIAAIAATVCLDPLSVIGGQDAGWDTLVAAASATLLLVISLPRTGRKRLSDVLEWRPVVAVGLVSYSVYLWHTPVIFLLRRWGVTYHGRLGLLGCYIVALAATLGLSALTYRFVEKPMLARKRGGLAQRETAQLETAAAAP